jgi:hypothetical protein
MRVFALISMLLGCAGGGSTCTPGASVACACIDGTQGAQTCRADGTYDTCVCVNNPIVEDMGGRTTNHNNTPDMATPVSTGGAKRVFVTSTAYVSSAVMSACGNAAAAANLGGTWQSWLSTSTLDAIDAVTGNGPWKLLNGQLVFNNHANLTTQPLAVINVDENGQTVPAGTRVWTGTDTGGRSSAGSNGTCADWGQVGADTGSYGSVDSTAEWSYVSYEPCFNPNHVYCFEL